MGAPSVDLLCPCPTQGLAQVSLHARSNAASALLECLRLLKFPALSPFFVAALQGTVTMPWKKTHTKHGTKREVSSVLLRWCFSTLPTPNPEGHEQVLFVFFSWSPQAHTACVIKPDNLHQETSLERSRIEAYPTFSTSHPEAHYTVYLSTP